MKVSKRQLKRIIREEKNKLITKTRLRRTVRRALREQAGGGLIKYRSVAEVMAGIADYYRAEYGPDADEFIQGNPTIRDFLFNDGFAVEEMAEEDLGNLTYDPAANTVSAGGAPEPIPGDLAAIAREFYNDRFLPVFLHLITGSVPRNVSFTPDGMEIYNNG